MEDRLLDLPTVRARIPVGRDTLFALIKSGELRSVKIGRRRLVPESAVNEYIAGLDVGPPGPDQQARESA